MSDRSLRLRAPESSRAPGAAFRSSATSALRLATCDWLLFVDADERVPPSLAQEVRARVAAPGETVGYWIPRRNIIAGEWVRHAGWWPDCQLRLLKRGHAHYDEGRVVHEVAILDGPEDTLTEPFLHLNYETLDEFRAKQRRYASLEARALWESGIRPKPHSLALQPIREFRRRMLTLGGVRQGPLGVRLGLEMALASFWTYRELPGARAPRAARPTPRPPTDLRRCSTQRPGRSAAALAALLAVAVGYGALASVLPSLTGVALLDGAIGVASGCTSARTRPPPPSTCSIWIGSCCSASLQSGRTSAGCRSTCWCSSPAAS